MSASPTRSMSAVVKAVLCGDVDMKLRRVLLSGCMSCTRMNLSSKRLLSLLRPLSPGMERTRTAVPCGNVNMGLHTKRCSVVTSTTFCSRRCYSAVVGNGNLLEGSAPPAGENCVLKVMFEGGHNTNITQHDDKYDICSPWACEGWRFLFLCWSWVKLESGSGSSPPEVLFETVSCPQQHWVTAIPQNWRSRYITVIYSVWFNGIGLN